MKTININIIGTPTDTPILYVDAGAIVAGRVDGARASFNLPDNAPTGHGATILYDTRSLRVLVPPYGAWEADQPPVKPPEATEPIVLDYAPRVNRLYVGDDSLVDEYGQRVVLGLASDFRLLHMWLRGEDIERVVKQRVDAGAQGFRVFGTCNYLFDLDPRDYGDYYGGLYRFAMWLLDRELYLHFTAITDGQLLERGFDQQAHWRTSCVALAHAPNVVICELANENIKNGVNAANFGPHSPSPLTSSGSFCDGWDPTANWGDVVTFHPRRDWKWWFTVPATAQEVRNYAGQHKPVWIGEPMGAGDNVEPGRRDNNPALFEKLGAGIGIFAAGGVFHSDAGLRSDLWSDTQRACAEAFFRGIHR